MVRVMSQHRGRPLGKGTKALLSAVALVAVGLPLSSGIVRPVQAQAQQAVKPDQIIVGTWQGTMHAGRDQRIVVKVARDENGQYKTDTFSIDSDARPTPADTTSFQDGVFRFAFRGFGGSYEGRMAPDGDTIDGTWKQMGNSLALTLTRATPETEWAIPKAAPEVPPMAADANPSFEVATIKPSKPGQGGKGLGFRGREFHTTNTDTNDLIAFAFGLDTRQIIGAPSWFDSDLFDITGLPDTPGRPDLKQMGMMVQKLLASRFQLKFHYEKRDLPVYAITVAKGGPNLTKATAAPNAPQGFGFRKLGDLYVRNMTMEDFASGMQSTVMDRPVVDQTGLKHRYDFHLDWTPDDSQFTQFRSAGMVVPASTNAANAPPDLYTAMRRQLGLKIEATKALDKVMVIDHVDLPSPN